MPDRFIIVCIQTIGADDYILPRVGNRTGSITNRVRVIELAASTANKWAGIQAPEFSGFRCDVIGRVAEHLNQTTGIFFAHFLRNQLFDFFANSLRHQRWDRVANLLELLGKVARK